jgi:serine protease Do
MAWAKLLFCYSAAGGLKKMDKQTVQVRRSVALVSLAATLLIGGALVWAIGSSGHPVFGAGRTVTLRVAAESSPQRAAAANLSEGFSSVLEPLLPAVVNISTSKVVKAPKGGGQNPFEDDPFFRQFFGNPNGGGGGQEQEPREQKEHSLGSGVIVSADGYIMTNNHVVDGATDVEVSLMDKRQFKAKVVGTDPRTDIAVLKIPATGLASVTIGSSAKMKVGDIVLAIGDPFGIGETATMGIVSATGRRSLDIEGPGGYEDFIQTDASINPGNSGGALVNTRGELIGINTAIISNGGGGNQGIGFAVPIDMARHVMEQLVSTGKVSRGYLGVSIQEVTPQLQKAFGLPSAQGALIGDVTSDGPGGKAGLQKGDVITAINGQPVPDYTDLRLRISQTAPGTAVKLDVYRNGQKREVPITLGEVPEKAETASAPEAGENPMDGVQISALTPDIAEQLSMPPGTHGVVVTQVDPDSAAAEAGLQRGDVIQEVNHKPVNNPDQFRAAIHAAGDQEVLMLLNRGGITSFAVIAPR